MKFLFPLIILLLFGCVPATTYTSSTGKTILMSDENYEAIVGMVEVYPTNSDRSKKLEYPVIGISSPGISIHFDLLEQNTSYINARYIHCNRDWTPSNLADIQFLNIYNAFSINNYNYSANTAIPYVNYEAQLPAPTKSGNYILVVYRENDPEDALFTRRFMVFQNQTSINTSIRASTIISSRQKNQQIDFDITYNGIDHANPLREFYVVMLQNHNWQNAIKGLQPTLIRTDQKYLEYHHFNQENNFPGLNEYRFFDMRMVDYRGMNISNILKSPNRVDAYLGIDQSRGNQSYTQVIKDIDGDYILENRDPSDSYYQSEYVNVHFELLSEPLNAPVFITGRFNNWDRNAQNMMSYDQNTLSYKGQVLLKQGYYNYFYYVDSPITDFYSLEGSHYQAENNYEILFYYRNPFNNYDELIGYKLFNSMN